GGSYPCVHPRRCSHPGAWVGRSSPQGLPGPSRVWPRRIRRGYWLRRQRDLQSPLRDPSARSQGLLFEHAWSRGPRSSDNDRDADRLHGRVLDDLAQKPFGQDRWLVLVAVLPRAPRLRLRDRLHGSSTWVHRLACSMRRGTPRRNDRVRTDPSEHGSKVRWRHGCSYGISSIRVRDVPRRFADSALRPAMSSFWKFRKPTGPTPSKQVP